MIKVEIYIEEDPKSGGNLRMRNLATENVTPGEREVARKIADAVHVIGAQLVRQPRVKAAVIIERESNL